MNVCLEFAKWLEWQEKSDHTMRVQNPATNWYSRSLQLPYAHYCLGITSSTVCFSHPLWKMGMQLKRAGGGMSPSLRAGLSASAFCGTPKACGERAGEGPAHLIVPSLLTLENLQLILPVQWLHVEEGEEVVLQALRKLVVSILSFAAAALFFFSPLIIPPSPCEWYVWTISFKTSFLSRLDGQQRQLCNQAKMCAQAFISCSGQSSKCLPPAFFFLHSLPLLLFCSAVVCHCCRLKQNAHSDP